MPFADEEVIDWRHKAHFLIGIEHPGDWSTAQVEIVRQTPDDFGYWMTACEYFLHKTAQLSPAGYEKALELLCKGAMTWRDKETSKDA